MKFMEDSPDLNVLKKHIHIDAIRKLLFAVKILYNLLKTTDFISFWQSVPFSGPYSFTKCMIIEHQKVAVLLVMRALNRLNYVNKLGNNGLCF